jgi:hypothetical protein
MRRTIIAVCVAVFLTSIAGGAEGTVNPVRIAKKALRISRDNRKDVGILDMQQQKLQQKMMDLAWDQTVDHALAVEAKRAVATGVGTFSDGELVTVKRPYTIPGYVVENDTVDCPAGTRPVSTGYIMGSGYASGFVTTQIVGEQLTHNGAAFRIDNSRKSNAVTVEIQVNCAPSSAP